MPIGSLHAERSKPSMEAYARPCFRAPSRHHAYPRYSYAHRARRGGEHSLMRGETIIAERPAKTPRPIANAPLFPSGVTVDRNIVRLFVAAAISCLQVATLIYGIKPAPLGLAASAAYILWAMAGLFPPRYGSPIFMMPVWAGRLAEL